MPFRKAVRKIHLWLGLTSGLIIVIVALTGCIVAYENEIRNLSYTAKELPQKREQKEKLPLSVLRKTAEAALGNKYCINRVIIDLSGRPVYVFRTLKINKEALTYWGYYDYYYVVYLNPYTGSIISIEDENNFFSIALGLHTHLLLGEKIGKPIIGYSTLLFFISLLSGIFLWFPKKKNKKSIMNGLKIKYKAHIKRLIYDLHNVLGFYTLIPLLLISFTGLVWAFKSFDHYSQYVVNGFSVIEKKELPKSEMHHKANASPKVEDNVLNYIVRNYAASQKIFINYPRKEEGTLSAFLYYDSVFYTSDQLLFDQYSGKLLKKINYREKSAGERFRSKNYDLHTGAYWGNPGRLLVFLSSLIAVTLPVTGFLIYKNKKHKKR